MRAGPEAAVRFGRIAVLPIVGILLLSGLPDGAARGVQTPFYPPCYGSTTGWGYPYGWNGSSFGGGSWSGNYTAGQFTGPWISAQTGSFWGSNYSRIADQGLASYGQGPKSHACFRPHATSSRLRVVFANFNFTVNLTLGCANLSTPSINAGYNISVGADLYDFSGAYHVLRPAPSRLIQTWSASCTKWHGGIVSHRVHLNGPFALDFNATGLVKSDRYWYIVFVTIGVDAQSPVAGAWAGAYFANFSNRVESISCPGC